MTCTKPFTCRPATTLLETAIAMNALIFLLFGVLIGGEGVLRYLQVANLAREAARWASVHGNQYSAETGQSAATQTSVYNTVILPAMFVKDTSNLSAIVNFSPNEWPTNYSSTSTPAGAAVTSTVSVTVTYNWSAILIPLTLPISSTAIMPMSY